MLVEQRTAAVRVQVDLVTEHDQGEPTVRHAAIVPGHALEREVGETGPVPRVDLVTPGDLGGQVGELPPTDGGREVRHPVVKPHGPVLVVQHRFAGLLGEVPRPLQQFRVTDEHPAPAGGDDLVAVERVDAETPPRPGVPAAPRGTEGLGGVLDHRHPVPGAHLGDPVELGGLSVQVDDDHRSRQAALGCCTLERIGEQVWIHVPRLGLGVDEPERRTDVGDGERRCRERQTRDPHLVTGADSGDHERQVERRRAARQGQCRRRTGELDHVGLETVDLGSERRDPVGVERRDQTLAFGAGHVRRRQVETPHGANLAPVDPGPDGDPGRQTTRTASPRSGSAVGSGGVTPLSEVRRRGDRRTTARRLEDRNPRHLIRTS